MCQLMHSRRTKSSMLGGAARGTGEGERERCICQLLHSRQTKGLLLGVAAGERGSLGEKSEGRSSWDGDPGSKFPNSRALGGGDRQISSGRVFMINTRARCNLLHTWII